MRRLALLLTMTPGAAHATDTDGDGVIDVTDDCPSVANPDQLDADGDGYGDACVHPNAVIGVGVALDRTCRVGAGAIIADGASCAAGAAVAPRARLDANASLGAAGALGRRSIVGVGSSFGGGAAIQADVDVGDAVDAGAQVVVGHGARVDDDVALGDDVVVGNLAWIGARSEVGPRASIGRGTQVGADARVGADVVLGPAVEVGDDAVLGANTRVRSGADVGAGAQVGGGVVLGRNVTLDPGATVGAGATLRHGVTVEGCAVVPPNDVVARGETVPCVEVGVDLNGGSRRWADGTFAPSCDAYRHPTSPYAYTGPGTGDGTYVINPAGTPILVNCDMTNDGGGWTQVARIHPTSGAHFTASALGSLTTVGESGAAKLSDALINTLRGPTYVESVVRFQCGPSTVFFADPDPFSATANGGGALDRCATTWDAATWTQATGYPEHWGLNTWQGAPCPYMIYFLTEQSQQGCYAAGSSNQAGTVWVK